MAANPSKKPAAAKGATAGDTETPLEHAIHTAEAVEHAAEDAVRPLVDEAVHLANETPHMTDEAIANVDHTIDRIRNMNEEMIESAAASGHRVLDTYEQTLRTMLEFQLSMAESTQIQWVNTMARAQAQFLLEVSSFYTKAARDLLG
ncbi:MAG: hypothetical protein Q4F67_14005 [Propionibacteriaceae bacterium]|nr:hypothetical protein [Propionibacteriaceae bacterium]